MDGGQARKRSRSPGGFASGAVRNDPLAGGRGGPTGTGKRSSDTAEGDQNPLEVRPNRSFKTRKSVLARSEDTNHSGKPKEAMLREKIDVDDALVMPFPDDLVVLPRGNSIFSSNVQYMYQGVHCACIYRF